MLLSQIKNFSKIKSVQRGITGVPSGKVYANTTISQVNIEKSELRHLSCKTQGMVYFANSTSIQAYSGDISYLTAVSWEITEWE